ncbi:SDR family oxidoreductase [Nocardiopsis changdeensis]|uniref:SDR family oxidoreductase n=1 Tax=Nocardiopsis changdeensis TaxID=2831969 RepID=A0ABX8BPN5_9ACTN|nr:MULTISPECIES: SDR family oxidoreductase [Nocardiopsis]QUX24039.1 SDR family oxidoreductase [Nocardiopsis changdeensis]QYX34435.1 SDR family oxidoreductase [Nocardiopsis sp. MT53]
MSGRRALVTGATGYIGGRLVPQLLDAGFEVRCLARDPGKLRDHPWRDRVEAARGDVVSGEGLAEALEGADVAYYLVHSMSGSRDFSGDDARGARNFAEAAAGAGVGRVIYLGGLAPEGEDLSAHMASRAEVGRILLDGPVPAAVLRAAVIIGSGSASFEMLRYLTERLPVMTTPRWVRSRVQPVAVRDVLRLLVEAADLPPEQDRTFDVGGPDVLTYAEMIQRFARVAGLRPRLILPVPVLSPGLSSLWVGLVTPVPPAIARPLVESLRHDAVCGEDDLSGLLGDHARIGFDRAVELAVRRTSQSRVDTRWTSASWAGAPSDPLPTDPDWAGGSLYTDERVREVDAPPEAVWRVVEGIGGERGWYSWPLAWAARGWIDLAVGGVGPRRGRRDPGRLRVGDSLDFWRVEEIVPGELLRLRAEMRLPGPAWLEFTVEPGRGRTVLRQRALFRPRGLLGHLYWAAVTPFHGVVFGSMSRNMARTAHSEAREPAAV